MMAALSKYGGDFYNNAIAQYGSLSGATSPYNATGGAQIGQTGFTNAASIGQQSLNTLGYGTQMTQPLTQQQQQQLALQQMLRQSQPFATVQ